MPSSPLTAMSSQDFTVPVVMEDLTLGEDNGGDNADVATEKPQEGALELPAGPELRRSPRVGQCRSEAMSRKQ